MKKITSAVLLAAVLVCFVACGGGGGPKNVYEKLCEAKVSQNIPMESLVGADTSSIVTSGDIAPTYGDCSYFKATSYFGKKYITVSPFRYLWDFDYDEGNITRKYISININVDLKDETDLVNVSLLGYQYDTEGVYVGSTKKVVWKDGFALRNYYDYENPDDGYNVVSYSFDLSKYIENGSFAVADATKTVDWKLTDYSLYKNSKGIEGTTVYTERVTDWQNDVLWDMVDLLNYYMAGLDADIKAEGITE